MKKIFTLIATALFAVGAQAQDAETLLLENGGTYTDNQELTTSSVKLVLGKDIKKATKWDQKLATATDYLKPFAQTVQVKNEDTGEMEDKSRVVYIVGGNNPKDDTENKGSGFNGSGEKGKLPQSGTYYMVTPSKAGTLLAGVILNSDKEFFVIDATDAASFTDEEKGVTYLQVENATANITHDKYKIVDDKGNELAYTDEAPAEGNGLYDGGKGGVKVKDKVTATVEFAVEANHTYYIFCTGSRLSFFGFVFTPSSSAPAEFDTWTVAGTQPLVDNSWDPADANAEMKTTDGVNYTYVKEDIVLEKGTNYQFKVVKGHAWGEEYPSSNYEFSVNETAKYTVTVTFNAESKEVAANAVKTGEAQAVEHTYSVIGTINGNWDADTDMTKGEDGVYTAVFENVAAGSYKFKVRVDHDWGVAYPSSDYAFSVEVDGSTVTVTFNEETKEVTAEVAAPSAINSVKAGKTAAVRYNLAGQKVNASYQGVVIENGKKMIQK